MYIDLADDLYRDDETRRSAYQEGANAAKQAFELEDSNAQAHFLYAASLGSAERLKGLTNAAMKVKEIKQHVARAIELDPKHAQALRTGRAAHGAAVKVLGGNEKTAQEYLERAIASDEQRHRCPDSPSQAVSEQERIEEAKKQLEAVIHAEHPHYPYTWVRKFKPEAERLLKDMAETS